MSRSETEGWERGKEETQKPKPKEEMKATGVKEQSRSLSSGISTNREEGAANGGSKRGPREGRGETGKESPESCTVAVTGQLLQRRPSGPFRDLRACQPPIGLPVQMPAFPVTSWMGGLLQLSQALI